MALTYDLTACDLANPLLDFGEDEQNDEQMKNQMIVNVAILSTMGIGIGVWTPGNIAEVKLRTRLWEAAKGPLLWEHDPVANKPQSKPMPEEYLDALVGMKTNVTDESRQAWLLRVFGSEPLPGGEDETIFDETGGFAWDADEGWIPVCDVCRRPMQNYPLLDRGWFCANYDEHANGREIIAIIDADEWPEEPAW